MTKVIKSNTLIIHNIFLHSDLISIYYVSQGDDINLQSCTFFIDSLRLFLDPFPKRILQRSYVHVLSYNVLQ